MKFVFVQLKQQNDNPLNFGKHAVFMSRHLARKLFIVFRFTNCSRMPLGNRLLCKEFRASHLLLTCPKRKCMTHKPRLALLFVLACFCTRRYHSSKKIVRLFTASSRSQLSACPSPLLAHVQTEKSKKLAFAYSLLFLYVVHPCLLPNRSVRRWHFLLSAERFFQRWNSHKPQDGRKRVRRVQTARWTEVLGLQARVLLQQRTPEAALEAAQDVMQGVWGNGGSELCFKERFQ